MSTNITEFTLPKNAYATFDATSMRQVIIDRLNENAVFKDQNFEGSNISSIIDIVAFMYHVLLFYLNQTASETMFSQATLFENMVKIVSTLNYKPVGDQTSILNFTTFGKQQLTTGQYTIPKFTSLTTSGVKYTLLDDLTFEKTNVSGTEELVTDNTTIYQGTLTEYPPYTATGEDFETVFVTFVNNTTPNSTADQRFISDNTIRVFVKEIESGVWNEYTEVSSLYLVNNSASRVYEKRLNENNQYEIKFGNNVNGRQLVEGDIVGVYFIVSDGRRGEVTTGSINASALVPFNSAQFNQIKANIYTTVNLLPDSSYSLITLSNEFGSIPYKEKETVDEIRQNAPKLFASQNRAVTLEDYTQYILKNFSDIIVSARAINNNSYINDYQNYFYNIGLTEPNRDPSVLLNQFSFMTSTNFNNIYLFVVPKYGVLRNEVFPTTLSIGQKQLVVNELDKIKLATHNLVPMDPIYKAFAFGLLGDGELPFYQAKDDTFLVLKRNVFSNLNREKIKSIAVTTVQDFFSVNNNIIGGVVDLTLLTNQLLSIDGVTNILTRRLQEDGSVKEVPYINMVVWNPNYPTQDVQFIAQNLILSQFEFPFLQEQSLISTKIIVEDE